MDVVAELTRLRYAYPATAREALAGVDLRLRRGELVLLAGSSGSGKSSVLRALCGLVPHFHGGRFSGRALVDGLDTRRVSPALVCARAGLVFQDPEAQSVMLTVDREVAFGLENAACPAAQIPSRVAAALAAARAGHLTGRRLAELSGGELQRVALASALAPAPPLLLLDEPTSQLDPAAADALVEHLRELCDRERLCVVVAEHRTDRVAAAADRIVAMEDGRIAGDGAPAEVQLPAASPPPVRAPAAGGEPLACLLDVTAGYGSRRVLAAASCELPAGSVTALTGPNGSGKTTLARVLAGLHPAAAGRIELCGADVTGVPAERRFPSVGYVGQDPGRYLLHERVDAEVEWALKLQGAGEPARGTAVAAALRLLGLDGLEHRHPRDLSGGERERVALASVLVAGPRVLVLDEPTRGMDAASKEALAAVLRTHAAGGGASLVITHDLGFAAAIADRRLRLRGGRVELERAVEEVPAR
jgi:energy-coupling factor transport system ATP-binding protein